VKECLIEATIRGVRPVNNEFNIIAGRCYLTKNGVAHLLREFPGLTDLRPRFGVPKMVGEKGALVAASAAWKLNGKPDSIEEREYPIRVNAGMGADAVLGKATRKLYAAIYAQLTGSEQMEGEVDDIETMRNVTPIAAEEKPAGTKVEQLAERLKGKAAPPAEEQEQKEEAAPQPDPRQWLLEQIGVLKDSLDAALHEGAGSQAAELVLGKVKLEEATVPQLETVANYMAKALEHQQNRPRETARQAEGPPPPAGLPSEATGQRAKPKGGLFG